MPRRQFLADLDQAERGSLPLGVSNVQPGAEDGQMEFLFTPDPDTSYFTPLTITALIPDLSEYPGNHEYMIFVDDDAPLAISAALQNLRGVSRKTIFELLRIISARLVSLRSDSDGHPQTSDSQDEADQSLEDNDEDDIYGSDHEAFEKVHPPSLPTFTQYTPGMESHPIDLAFRTRVRADLWTAKAAGFKVGILGKLLDKANAFVTISIRVSKLGISDEAMEAWQIDPSDYLILILQYPNGYRTSGELQDQDNGRLSSFIGMRVVAGRRYKPTLQEAITAFATTRQGANSTTGSSSIPSSDDVTSKEWSIRNTFISKPLTGLLQERLVPILRYRAVGLNWRGAEDWYTTCANTGLKGPQTDSIPGTYFLREKISSTIPDIAKADHYANCDATRHSLPLIAMQFLLRHFARCTDFCLVCHRKLVTDVEAIKPYVCDRSLCLYQYMSLGFGPSIEHEVLAQPYVVDLLISFCYSSAINRKLKEFPEGLSLMVAPIDQMADIWASQHDPHQRLMKSEELKKNPKAKHTYQVRYDPDRLEIIFWDKSEDCPVRKGTWIVMTTAAAAGSEFHCRVKDTTYYPTINIDTPVILDMFGHVSAMTGSSGLRTPQETRPTSPATSSSNWLSSSFRIYDQDFEDLDKDMKCHALCKLLDTLPSVFEMQGFLSKNHPTELSSWVDRISPPALALLRWIIASNRACIMQVDGRGQLTAETLKNGAKGPSSSTLGKPQERLYGMEDFMQFRFAMGAPDKEQRFFDAVSSTTARLSLQYPTIFAWHGSPVHNWHMIIREGLHFKYISHGRAYGDGIYHARDASIAMTYSSTMQYANHHLPKEWRGSQLRISSAVALNEIVNAPGEFRSTFPYFVLQQLDWIQTRFLFVRCSPASASVHIGKEEKPRNAHPQDPKNTPRGVSDVIVIPASAIKSGRRSRQVREQNDRISNPSPQKKLKGAGGFDDPIAVGGCSDIESVATDTEDLEVLYGEDPEPEQRQSDGQSQRLAIRNQQRPDNMPSPNTDFVPNSLDFENLPIMPLPTYASPATTKRLMKELLTLQKFQTTTPLAELGWFIDVEKIENVYQWIVELHSFHMFEDKNQKLPLVADMKKKGVKSIVLEVRFNRDFPFTPPYVRVLSPRFLTLVQGGGGHIVMGGALCMELLTNSGWSSVSSMESVLMQVRMAIASEPFARLELYGRSDYGVQEAADGYIRACRTHDWQVPPGFKEMAYGSVEEKR